MSRTKRKREPYQMKGVDAILGDESPPRREGEAISIACISLPQNQPRSYFDSEALQELIESVKRHGILMPLLVRPQGDGRYELVAGERRFRAATAAGLEEVPVTVRELNDEETFELALLENLQREDLSPVEETEGILELLRVKLKRDVKSVISLLNRAAHPERASVDNVIHSKDWEIIEAVFATIGKFTPESFRTNRLPLLSLPEDVLEPLREGAIAYTKGRAIARVKNDWERRKLLDLAIEENLSLSQIKERVAQVKSGLSQGNGGEKDLNSLKGRVDVIYRRMKQSKVWDDPKKRKQLDKLLKNLEALLEVNE